MLGRQYLHVAVISGYDIGVMSNWSTEDYTHTPAKWRARLAAAPHP